jgi:hypothetical protein
MLTRKFKKNMMGGATKQEVPEKPDEKIINNNFRDLFMLYLSNQEPKLNYDKGIITSSKGTIYVGFNDTVTKDTFGIIRKVGDIKDTNCENIKNYIVDTTLNKSLVNQCKLYIMSNIANYTLSNGHTLFTDLDEPIKALDIPKIIEILEVKEDEKAAPVLSPVSKVNDDDMLELQIYREFGVKCTTQFSTSSCFKYDEEYKDYWIKKANPNKIDFKKVLSDDEKQKITGAGAKLFKQPEQLRNLYVNMFEYITGTEGNNSGFETIRYALHYLKMISNNTFYGFKSGLIINIDKLIDIVNKIRNNVIDRQLIKNNPYRLKL